jgi:phage-related protein
LQRGEQLEVSEDIKAAQICQIFRPPLAKSLGDGLWEIRSKLATRNARVIFYTRGREMILLHGFIKKTQQIPHHDLELAKKRKKQHESKG